MSASVSQRSALEVAVIRAVLGSLEKAGYSLFSVDDGEQTTRVLGADAALALALNLDHCVFRFRPSGWIYLVFGNDGWDVVSDYSAHEQEFTGAIEAVDPEGVPIPAACAFHVWAWVNPARQTAYGPIAEAHGGCVKCGRHQGDGEAFAATALEPHPTERRFSSTDPEGNAEPAHYCRCCGEETDTGRDCCSDDFPEPGEVRETGK